ncbi:MAG: NUDIX domain-containing protein, partial [Pseudomonadales bacterium]|nr:NUDIX domain-containing protein [Pseudomonadales bacterium]
VEACAGLLERKSAGASAGASTGASTKERTTASTKASTKASTEESPEACIVREVEEETGYKISQPQKIGQVYMSPGAVTEIIHLFIAEYTDGEKVGEGGGLHSEHEDIEVLQLDFAEAWSMLEAGEIRDAKTIILLQHAKLHNLFANS